VFVLTMFLVFYPDPRVFYRHISHIQQADRLPNPDDPTVLVLSDRLDGVMARQGGDENLLTAVEELVYEEIEYAWDWDVWGAVDYLPSVDEVIEEGREDCDGRAVVAAAILRARGIDAQLVGDLRHVWVRTPLGDTMTPLGAPVYRVSEEKVEIDWHRLLDPGPMAFGVSVFPLVRESIILLVAWILVLPSRIRWPTALVGLGLMIAGLFVVRFAGREPLDPKRWLIVLSLLFVLSGLVIAAVLGRKTQKDTDRTVCR